MTPIVLTLLGTLQAAPGSLDDLHALRAAPAHTALSTQALGVTDADGDGYDSHNDCDDTDSSTHPGAYEYCDGIDNDCDGWVDEDCGSGAVDADGDGYDDYEDCDDSDSSVNPGAAEDCDGIDNDCDGVVDEDCDETDADGDGYGEDEDCDDTDDSINPGAAEECDGIDNDCDGVVDEDCTDDTGAEDTNTEDTGAPGEGEGCEGGHGAGVAYGLLPFLMFWRRRRA